MSLLLDTHVLLWWLEGTHLTDAVVDRIADPGELVVVSAASIWEASIKAALGKLDMPEALGDAVLEEGFEPLPVTFAHAEHAGQLPPHHRDPFDRMLVCQAIAHGMVIVTDDEAIRRYPTRCLW